MQDRPTKVGKEIARELGPIIDEASKQLLSGMMATVMDVKITPDLGLARVYLSLFGEGNKEEAMAILQSNLGTIRKYLAGQMRHRLRKIPDLELFLDETADTAHRIDELLRQMRHEDNENEDLGE